MNLLLILKHLLNLSSLYLRIHKCFQQSSVKRHQIYHVGFKFVGMRQLKGQSLFVSHGSACTHQDKLGVTKFQVPMHARLIPLTVNSLWKEDCNRCDRWKGISLALLLDNYKIIIIALLMRTRNCMCVLVHLSAFASCSILTAFGILLSGLGFH